MDKDLVFEDLEIRDQNDHNSDVSAMGEYNAETLIGLNSLDQEVALQLQGSIDKTIWLDVGQVFNVAATTNEYETVSDYFPFYRIVASCASTPTTGNLNVWVVKSK